jgi:hypothetical protein
VASAKNTKPSVNRAAANSVLRLDTLTARTIRTVSDTFRNLDLQGLPHFLRTRGKVPNANAKDVRKMAKDLSRNSVSLSFRGIFLVMALMILVFSALAVPVLAQSVTIAKVDRPPMVLYGGSDLLSVQALIEYSGAGRGTDYVLTVLLLDLTTNDSIRGSDVTLIANPCGGIPNYVPQGSTFCPVLLRSPNGTETVQFRFSSSHVALPPIWNLTIRAALGPVKAPSPSITQMYNFAIPVSASQEFVSTLSTSPTAGPETQTAAASSSTTEYAGFIFLALAIVVIAYALRPKKKRSKALKAHVRLTRRDRT